ncbi:MAG: hypothetical protein ACPGF7_02075 [Pontibacterium sp.]
MRYLILSALLVISSPVLANCSIDQTLCETQCKVKNLNDEASLAGCNSKCVAIRAACSAEKGAEKAVELGKGAWENTKAFIKGATE